MSARFSSSLQGSFRLTPEIACFQRLQIGRKAKRKLKPLLRMQGIDPARKTSLLFFPLLDLERGGPGPWNAE